MVAAATVLAGRRVPWA